MTSGTFKPTASSPLVIVERAVMDLRRGLPVVISGDDGWFELIAASELTTPKNLAELKTLSGGKVDCLITHHRATTLKIRLYTPEAVAISLPDGPEEPAVTLIRHLADPATDLENPLSGPFNARRIAMSRPRLQGIKLVKLAGLLPSVLAAPVATPAKAKTSPGAWAGERGLLCIKAEDIEAYEGQSSRAMAPAQDPYTVDLSMVAGAKVPLSKAEKTQIVAFRPQGALGSGPEHLAIIIGEIDADKPVLVRLHSECFTGDLLGSLKCDCGDQLRGAIEQIAKSGSGVLLYLAQEGRGIGLMNKLRAYHLQDLGFDTVEANIRLGFDVDERLFEAAAEMLKKLSIKTISLMTNNPDKVSQLEQYGITVNKRVAHKFPSNQHNEHYLATKVKKTGHLL